MRSAPIAFAISTSVILLGASTAWAQSPPPRKTKSPAEVEQAVDD
jgi:hypothetical protein